MKKLFALALMLVLTVGMLTACGGGEPATTTPSDEPAAAQEPAATNDSTDLTVQLKELEQKNIEMVNVYNEVAALINQNGWTEDETTVQDVTAASAFIELNNSIIQDPSNVKADELQDVISTTEEMTKELDTNVRARVSVPFEEEGGK